MTVKSFVSKAPRFQIRRGFFLFFVFCLFVCSIFVKLIWAKDFLAKNSEKSFLVEKIYDGDTVRLKNGSVVRFLGVDTPEIGKKGEPSQYFAVKAKQKTVDLLAGKRVRLKIFGYDRYKRILAVVFLPDGQNVNEILLRSGVAFYFPHQKERGFLSVAEPFLAAQREAIIAREGFWSMLCNLSISPIYGNRRSLRFHLPNCPYCPAKGNQVIFSSVCAAFSAGFAPCRTCTPFQLLD